MSLNVQVKLEQILQLKVCCLNFGPVQDNSTYPTYVMTAMSMQDIYLPFGDGAQLNMFTSGMLFLGIWYECGDFRVVCVPRPWRRWLRLSSRSIIPSLVSTSTPTRGYVRRSPSFPASLCATRSLGKTMNLLSIFFASRRRIIEVKEGDDAFKVGLRLIELLVTISASVIDVSGVVRWDQCGC